MGGVQAGQGDAPPAGHGEGGCGGNEPEVAVGRAREGGEPASAMLERLHDPARVLALTDGVFAIIITLLVLEIHVPSSPRATR